MGILRDRMIEEMKLRNFSSATQQSYVYAVSRLAKHHHKSPDQLSKEDIRAFLVHLTVQRKLSPNSLTGYRDRKNQDRKRAMTLDAHEFIRRFLLHVVPKG